MARPERIRERHGAYEIRMRNVVKCGIGALLIAVLLLGARSIIRMNEAAMGSEGQATAFYGH